MARRTARGAVRATALCTLAAVMIASATPTPVRAQSATPAFAEVAVTRTVAATADTYVSAPPAHRPAGTAPRLVVDGNPRRQAFVRFAVPDFEGRLRSATLRLHGAELAGAGSVQGGIVRRSSDVDWSETAMSWADRPPLDGPLVGVLGPVTRDRWVDLPVTMFVRRGVPLTFGIGSNHPDAAAYDSRGSGAGPRLELVLDAPPDGVVVAAVGDMVCSNVNAVTPVDCHHQQVSDLLVADPDLDAFLALGDLQYPSGTLNDFQQHYEPSFGRVKAITHPVVGNHKYQSPDASGYFDYFGAVAGPRGRGWYSFDLGARWHLVALNSNCDEVGCGDGSPQLDWLRTDLRANTRPCVLAYWHHPRWSSGGNPRQDLRVEPFVRVLAHHGAEVALAGHVHNYERFAPQRPDGTAAVDGLRQFVVGTGGRSVGPDHGFREPSLRHSQRRIAGVFGLARLVLTDTGYWWSFVDETGRVRDSGSARCR